MANFGAHGGNGPNGRFLVRKRRIKEKNLEKRDDLETL